MICDSWTLWSVILNQVANSGRGFWNCFPASSSPFFLSICAAFPPKLLHLRTCFVNPRGPQASAAVVHEIRVYFGTRVASAARKCGMPLIGGHVCICTYPPRAQRKAGAIRRQESGVSAGGQRVVHLLSSSSSPPCSSTVPSSGEIGTSVAGHTERNRVLLHLQPRPM